MDAPSSTHLRPGIMLDRDGTIIVDRGYVGRDHGLRTIAVTGFDGGAARAVAEVSIHVDCTNYGIVEDLSQAIMHALAQYIHQSRMTADAISTTVF
jgi:hypothetical protein